MLKYVYRCIHIHTHKHTHTHAYIYIYTYIYIPLLYFKNTGKRQILYIVAILNGLEQMPHPNFIQIDKENIGLCCWTNNVKLVVNLVTGNESDFWSVWVMGSQRAGYAASEFLATINCVVLGNKCVICCYTAIIS